MTGSRKSEYERGREIAIRLGWPRHRIGWIGAFGSLLDFTAPIPRPRSTTCLIAERRAEAERAAREYPPASSEYFPKR